MTTSPVLTGQMLMHPKVKDSYLYLRNLEKKMLLGSPLECPTRHYDFISPMKFQYKFRQERT